MPKIRMVHDAIDAAIDVWEDAVAHYESAGWRRKDAEPSTPLKPSAATSLSLPESAPAPDVPDASVSPDTPDTGDTPKEQ